MPAISSTTKNSPLPPKFALFLRILEKIKNLRQLTSSINNFIISERDKLNMAIVVQRSERTTVARKTGVRLSPFAFQEGKSELRIPQNSIFAFEVSA